jgi:hypothetical protein
VIHQRLRRGATAALAAINRDKVGRIIQSFADNPFAEFADEMPAANRGFNPTGRPVNARR